MRGWALAAAVLLALVGCEGGPLVPPVSEGTGGEAAGLDITLTSYARTGGDTATGSAARLTTGGGQGNLVPVDGEVLVVPAGGGATVYSWALLVDENAFRVNTAVTLNLEAGSYDFRFVMHAGGNTYAGSALERLIVGADGTSSSNRIPFTLVPVLTGGPVTAAGVEELGELRILYDANEIRGYDQPAFSLSVDGGAAPLFSVNPTGDTPALSVLMAPGPHHVVLRVYDGTLLKLVAEYDVVIELGAAAEIDVQPLVSEVTYNYVPGTTPDQDTGNVQFLVPGTIVDEAGGLEQVQASAAVVGPLTPLAEQDLLLAPDVNTASSYSASMEVPGLTAGALTWSLQFRRQDGTLYAYCAQSVVIPQPTSTAPLSGSFLCTPKMVVQAVPAAEPVSPLNVGVEDVDGPVPGAVVKANTEPLGITSGGAVTGSELGKLGSFLSAGVYGLRAEQDVPDPFNAGATVKRSSEEAVVAPADGQAVAATLRLESLATPPPPPPDEDDGDQPGEDDDNGLPAEDSIELTAKRRSWPLRFYDEFVHLSGWAKIRIPAAEDIEVLEGDPQRFLVVLSFGRRDLRCWYLGGDWDGAVEGWLDDLVQNTFSNPICTRGKSGGDALWVRGPVRMRVVGGSRQFRNTEVRLLLPVIEVSDHRPGQEQQQRPPHWRGRGHWDWWGWWRDAGHERDHD
jgi:hypothetical protein